MLQSDDNDDYEEEEDGVVNMRKSFLRPIESLSPSSNAIMGVCYF